MYSEDEHFHLLRPWPRSASFHFVLSAGARRKASVHRAHSATMSRQTAISMIYIFNDKIILRCKMAMLFPFGFRFQWMCAERGLFLLVLSVLDFFLFSFKREMHEIISHSYSAVGRIVFSDIARSRIRTHTHTMNASH